MVGDPPRLRHRRTSRLSRRGPSTRSLPAPTAIGRAPFVKRARRPDLTAAVNGRPGYGSVRSRPGHGREARWFRLERRQPKGVGCATRPPRSRLLTSTLLIPRGRVHASTVIGRRQSRVDPAGERAFPLTLEVRSLLSETRAPEPPARQVRGPFPTFVVSRAPSPGSGGLRNSFSLAPAVGNRATNVSPADRIPPRGSDRLRRVFSLARPVDTVVVPRREPDGALGSSFAQTPGPARATTERRRDHRRWHRVRGKAGSSRTDVVGTPVLSATPAARPRRGRPSCRHPPPARPKSRGLGGLGRRSTEVNRRGVVSHP